MKYFLVLSFLFLQITLFSKEKPAVTFLSFNSFSKTDEKIDFLETKVPEILKTFIDKKSPLNFETSLAWERSKSAEDWHSKTEISAYENGILLKSDFVIFGNIVLENTGYSIKISVFYVRAKKIVYIAEKASAEDEDLYGMLEKLSIDLNAVLENEVQKFLDEKITFKKILSFEGSAGYPVPIGDYLNIQIGAFFVEGGMNITYKFAGYKNVNFHFRGGLVAGFGFLFFNPKKIEGYFYEINVSCPFKFLVDINSIICIVFGAGYSNFFHVYRQKGIDGIFRNYFDYAPGITAGLDFEMPLKINKQVLLGMKNNFNFIFYQGETEKTIKPKFQYIPCFYFLYKLEI